MRVVPLPVHLLITHGWNVEETIIRAGWKGRFNDATEVCTRTKLCCNHVKDHSAHRIGCSNNAKDHSDPPNGLLQHVKAHSAHRMGCCNMQKTILPTEWVVATCKRPFRPSEWVSNFENNPRRPSEWVSNFENNPRRPSEWASNFENNPRRPSEWVFLHFQEQETTVSTFSLTLKRTSTP